MAKFVEHTSPETILNYLVPLVATENPQMRSEGLNFILKYKDFITKAEMSTFVKPLVQCLQDKAPAIRAQCEEVAGYVMLNVGYNAFHAVI
jgi:hypothetical protein